MILSQVLIILGASLSAYSETVHVNIKDIDSKQSDGAIIIRKEPINNGTLNPQFEITQGDEEIVSDPAPLLKQARTNWKKSCDDWKKEMKDNNKTNQIISLSCGSMECLTASAETSCKSKGNYKIKVRL